MMMFVFLAAGGSFFFTGGFGWTLLEMDDEMMR
jgi:hypothetical protein